MDTVSRRRKALAWAADLVSARVCKSTAVMDGANLIDEAYADCPSEEHQEILSEALNAICRAAKHPDHLPFEDWRSLLANALYAAMWVSAAKVVSDRPKVL